MQKQHQRLVCYNVNLHTFQKIFLPFESCITLVARFESIVISNMTLQITRRRASIIALVAFMWFFACMIFLCTKEDSQ